MKEEKKNKWIILTLSAENKSHAQLLPNHMLNQVKSTIK